MKSRNIKRLLTIATIFGLFVITTKTVFADTIPGTSSNWAGYISQDGSAYTGVSGTWIIPEISYSTTLTSNATWIGIGGRTTNDLIQAGVYEIANSDGAAYQAWYELLPDNAIPITLPVHPGESISVAIIQTSPGVWNIVITNNTSGKQFEKTVSYQSSLSSAEWIQERPLIDGSFSSLSGFTPINFSGATVVKNGQRIAVSQANAQLVTMMDTPTQYALAVPSSLDTVGMSFSIARTSAKVSPTTTITPPYDSFVSPYVLRRTGQSVMPIEPGVTWVWNF